jgi:hypothetical protein
VISSLAAVHLASKATRGLTSPITAQTHEGLGPHDGILDGQHLRHDGVRYTPDPEMLQVVALTARRARNLLRQWPLLAPSSLTRHLPTPRDDGGAGVKREPSAVSAPLFTYWVQDPARTAELMSALSIGANNSLLPPRAGTGASISGSAVMSPAWQVHQQLQQQQPMYASVVLGATLSPCDASVAQLLYLAARGRDRSANQSGVKTDAATMQQQQQTPQKTGDGQKPISSPSPDTKARLGFFSGIFGRNTDANIDGVDGNAEAARESDRAAGASGKSLPQQQQRRPNPRRPSPVFVALTSRLLQEAVLSGSVAAIVALLHLSFGSSAIRNNDGLQLLDANHEAIFRSVLSTAAAGAAATTVGQNLASLPPPSLAAPAGGIPVVATAAVARNRSPPPPSAMAAIGSGSPLSRATSPGPANAQRSVSVFGIGWESVNSAAAAVAAAAAAALPSSVGNNAPYRGSALGVETDEEREKRKASNFAAAASGGNTSVPHDAPNVILSSEGTATSYVGLSAESVSVPAAGGDVLIAGPSSAAAAASRGVEELLTASKLPASDDGLTLARSRMQLVAPQHGASHSKRLARAYHVWRGNRYGAADVTASKHQMSELIASGLDVTSLRSGGGATATPAAHISPAVCHLLAIDAAAASSHTNVAVAIIADAARRAERGWAARGGVGLLGFASYAPTTTTAASLDVALVGVALGHQTAALQAATSVVGWAARTGAFYAQRTLATAPATVLGLSSGSAIAAATTNGGSVITDPHPASFASTGGLSWIAEAERRYQLVSATAAAATAVVRDTPTPVLEADDGAVVSGGLAASAVIAWRPATQSRPAPAMPHGDVARRPSGADDTGDADAALLLVVPRSVAALREAIPSVAAVVAFAPLPPSSAAVIALLRARARMVRCVIDAMAFVDGPFSDHANAKFGANDPLKSPMSQTASAVLGPLGSGYNSRGTTRQGVGASRSGSLLATVIRDHARVDASAALLSLIERGPAQLTRFATHLTTPAVASVLTPSASTTGAAETFVASPAPLGIPVVAVEIMWGLVSLGGASLLAPPPPPSPRADAAALYPASARGDRLSDVMAPQRHGRPDEQPQLPLTRAILDGVADLGWLRAALRVEIAVAVARCKLTSRAVAGPNAAVASAPSPTLDDSLRGSTNKHRAGHDSTIDRSINQPSRPANILDRILATLRTARAEIFAEVEVATGAADATPAQLGLRLRHGLSLLDEVETVLRVLAATSARK